MNETTVQWYVPSQDNTLLSKVLCFSFGLVLVYVLAFVYGIVCAINPAIYIGVLLAVGFGYLMGILYRVISKLCKVRDKKFVVRSGGVLAFLAVYFSWAAYLIYFFQEGDNLVASYFLKFMLVFRPDFIFEILVEINREGMWEIFGTPFSGLVLMFIWMAEAAIIIFMTVKLLNDYTISPFNARLNKWYGRYTMYDEFKSVPNTQYFMDLEGGLADKMNELKRGGSTRFGRVSVYFLEDANEQYFLYENVNRDRKGRKERADPVVNCMKISTQEARELIKQFHGKKQFFLDY